MERIIPFITYVIVGLLLVLILKLVFKLGIKPLLKIIINILVGGMVLFLINYIPGIEINITVIKAVVVGFLGFPGVVVVLIYYFLFER